MKQTKTNPVLHLLPSLTDLAFLLPVIMLFTGMMGVKTMLGDGDTGWHIRTGQWIMANHRVPAQDIFSFTRPGQPWFAWEWLWDVLFAVIHNQWGLGGVVFASVLVLCATSALLYRLAYRITARVAHHVQTGDGQTGAETSGTGNPLIAIALTCLAMAGTSLHWLARPHLFTMLFIVIFMTVLDRVRESQKAGRKANLLWLLPALTILWTNLHGGFFVGIIILGAYAGGDLLRGILASNREERIAGFKSAMPYLYTAAACAAVSFINPYFYHLHEHILTYLRDPFQMKYIQEFQGTNFQMRGVGYFEIMMVMALGAAVWYGRRKQYAEVLLIVGWGHLALIAARNVPIFMLVIAPVVARPVVHWLTALAEAPVAKWVRSLFGTIGEISEELNPLERTWRIHAVSAAVLVVLALIIDAPHSGIKLKAEYDPKVYPLAALPELTRQPGQRVFTHDEWGDYLIYKLSPKGTQVFVDGRSDFYGPVFGQDYVDVMNVKYDWAKTLDRYGVDTILLPADAPLAGAIKQSRRWRVTYDDGMALVFRPVLSSAARVDQISASNTGGTGERNFRITAVSPNVTPESHEFKSSWRNP